MPILSPSNNACIPIYPTAQNVIDSVAADLLNRIAPEDPVLLDYTSRVQLQLLRASRWVFLQSAPQLFVTQLGRTDYWIGPSGQAPLDTIDTGLNIYNLGPIKTDTFYDRSNFRLLSRTKEPILEASFSQRDGKARQGPPRVWRNAPDTPCIVNLYPAPDNQNAYQPVPEAPALSAVFDGNSLPARIYFARVTYVDSLGNESSASNEARVFVPAGSVLVCQPPLEIVSAASGVQYNSWNLYLYNAGTQTTLTSGNETLVNASPMANSVPYQEPDSGFVTGGTSFPTANAVEELGGYLIQFRYYQAKPQVTTITQPLLIPSDYFDVLVAGVNYFTAQFLKDKDSAMYWKAEYDAGVIGMIRDKNLFPKAPSFIHPDPASVSYINYYGYESIDPYYLPTS